MHLRPIGATLALIGLVELTFGITTVRSTGLDARSTLTLVYALGLAAGGALATARRRQASAPLWLGALAGVLRFGGPLTAGGPPLVLAAAGAILLLVLALAWTLTLHEVAPERAAAPTPRVPLAAAAGLAGFAYLLAFNLQTGAPWRFAAGNALDAAACLALLVATLRRRDG